MRAFWSGVVLTVAVLLPNVGNAQVYQFRTPPPDVSAAAAEWQANSEPIVVGGLTYYPTRGFRQFDGQVMSQTGMYDNVPVYVDTTLEPYMEIYVPLGSGRMRVYERRRDRELAGTTGSHVPTFPVESPSVQPADRFPSGGSRMTGIGGTDVPRAVSDSTAMPESLRPRRTSIITAVPRSGAPDGVWIEFNGARWYSSGAAVPFSPEQFAPIGEYHGFPVYRDKTAGSDELWVASVKDGPVAPYRKRQ
jgi:hypothetical protein